HPHPAAAHCTHALDLPLTTRFDKRAHTQQNVNHQQAGHCQLGAKGDHIRSTPSDLACPYPRIASAKLPRKPSNPIVTFTCINSLRRASLGLMANTPKTPSAS